MRKLLAAAIWAALPAAALADSPECLISFAGAQHDVCEAAPIGSASGDPLRSVLAVAQSSLRIVKFSGPITWEQREAVEREGARIIGYAPYFAYVVRMPANLDTRMLAIDGVRWAGPMLPALKVDPNINAELSGAGIVADLGIEDLVITLDAEQGQASLSHALSGLSGLSSVRVQAVGGELRAQAGFDRGRLHDTVAELALRDDVLAIEFRKPARLLNSQGHWLHQSGKNTPQPNASIWDQGLYGCGQTIGVLDSGLWLDNVAFRDPNEPPAMAICNNGTSCAAVAAVNSDARKVVAYYKWSGQGNGSWYDYSQGHGTHVAGSVAGNHLLDNPVNCDTPAPISNSGNLDGMAPGAKIVMQEAGSGLDYLNDFGGGTYHAAGIAYHDGARIHTNSWGGGCVNPWTQACVSGCTVPYDSWARDADRIMHDNEDLLVLFAAGNDGTKCPNGNNVGSPGNAKNVISVGASGRGTSGNSMTSFSSRGPTLDGRTKPDLVAQGSGIISANTNPSGTRSESGTSMATPTAAGLAALVREYLVRGYYPSGEPMPGDAIPNPSGALIKAILATGAVKLTGSGASANPGQVQGFGSIRLEGSLHFYGEDRRLFIEDAEDGLETGDHESFNLDVDASEPLSIVLTWTDRPGMAGASPATVNSLRLEVEDPNGAVWTQKLPANHSVNNASPFQDSTDVNHDGLNNLHRISFDTPISGSYEVRVRGISIPQGPQKYALAVAGRFDATVDPGFALSVNPNHVAICAGDPAQYTVGVASRWGFDGAVNLLVSGLPGAATGQFATNPVIASEPAALTQLTVNNTAGLGRGLHDFQIEGFSSTAVPDTRQALAKLWVSEGMPQVPVLSTPDNGADDQGLTPAFSWTADPDAESYTIELAKDAAFNQIVASATVTSNSWTPAAMLDVLTSYYWRVRANSICGGSAWSQAASFTTGQPFPLPYCDVTFGNAVEPITRVVLSGIDNSSPAAVNGSPALEDFLGVAGGDVEPGASYDLRVEGNTGGNYNTLITAYVDWDRDGTFSLAEKTSIGSIRNSTGTDGKHAQASIAVPESVTPGPVRMRVLKRYSQEAADACNGSGSGWGQAEDYTLMVHGSYTIGGTASGLGGQSISLSLNGGAGLVVNGDGSFVFPDELGGGVDYTVRLIGAPSNLRCSVANASGLVNGADVTDVDVTCEQVVFTGGFEY